MKVVQMEVIPNSEAYKPDGQRSGHVTTEIDVARIIGAERLGDGNCVRFDLNTGESHTVDLAASASLPVVDA